jgi:outer membrane receptor protein involved in Fe transport
MDLAALLLSLTLRLVDMQRPRISETVTVTSVGPSIAIPAAVTVLDRQALESAPAGTVDDALRSIPGFGLFRRSSSRVANPTTQGATLRGLAASGASRALVLADGIPMNDPVGGWVYWNRVPAVALKEVSVARGAAGDLHGADALAGVVAIRSADEGGARLLVEAGSHGSGRVSAYGGTTFARGMFHGAAEGLTTDGFVTVAPDVRGSIDTPAGSRHGSAHAAAYIPTAPMALTIRASHFAESRRNGTPVQRNATEVTLLSMHAAGLAGDRGGWVGSGYASSQEYEQTFSAVLAGRASERQTSAQVVGATSAGAHVDYWSQVGRQGAQFGLRLATRHVTADITETPFSFAGTQLPAQRTDASQLTAAAAAHGQVHRPRFGAGGGLRVELWRADGGNSHVVASPKLWITHAAAGLTLRAAFQSGFRGPTINELHRGFRVGNVVTQANAQLRPERARGLEAGASWIRGPVVLRGVVFWSRVNDAIVNVTLPQTGTVILRERQNAARIRAAGTEIEAEVRVSPGLTITGASSYTDSVFTEGPLSGLRVPQVARLQHALGARAAAGPLRLSVEWRYVGRQYDDDRNAFPLDRSSITDARVGWRLSKRTEVFGAMENVLDEEQDVGRTPLRTLGLPRTTRVGVRVILP